MFPLPKSHPPGKLHFLSSCLPLTWKVRQEQTSGLPNTYSMLPVLRRCNMTESWPSMSSPSVTTAQPVYLTPIDIHAVDSSSLPAGSFNQLLSLLPSPVSLQQSRLPLTVKNSGGRPDQPAGVDGGLGKDLAQTTSFQLPKYVRVSNGIGQFLLSGLYPQPEEARDGSP